MFTKRLKQTIRFLLTYIGVPFLCAGVFYAVVTLSFMYPTVMFISHVIAYAAGLIALIFVLFLLGVFIHWLFVEPFKKKGEIKE